MARKRTEILLETRSGGEQAYRILPVDLIAQERAQRRNPALDGVEGAVYLGWVVLRRVSPDTAPADFDAWVRDDLLDLWTDNEDEDEDQAGKAEAQSST